MVSSLSNDAPAVPETMEGRSRLFGQAEGGGGEQRQTVKFF